MRSSLLPLLAFPVLLLPAMASAQEPGLALNMGRGLDNGMSMGWTFKENWTLRPTIAAAYSQQTGFQASLGSTVLRSFSFGSRFYAYVGAGVYYGSANSGRYSNLGGPVQGIATSGRGTQNNQTQSVNPLAQNNGSLMYLTAPVGLRARIFGNFEAFVEGAYQRTMIGQFGLSQSGQFGGNGAERVGGTVGISLRLQ